MKICQDYWRKRIHSMDSMEIVYFCIHLHYNEIIEKKDRFFLTSLMRRAILRIWRIQE